MNKMKTENYVNALTNDGFNFDVNLNGFETSRGIFKVRVNIKKSVIDGETFDTTKLKIMNWYNVHQVHAVREGNFYYMDWVN